jgi:flagellar basal-body rod modification protein FlgD
MSAITSSGALAGPVRDPVRGFSEISSEEFVSIMMSELSHQDPLEPQDSEKLLDQISTIRAIESDEKMLDSLTDMVGSNEFASAANLIGTLISGVTEDNRRAVDVVLSVSRTEDGPILNLFDGSRVPFQNVDEVVAPLDQQEDPDDGDDEDGDGDDP